MYFRSYRMFLFAEADDPSEVVIMKFYLQRIFIYHNFTFITKADSLESHIQDPPITPKQGAQQATHKAPHKQSSMG